MREKSSRVTLDFVTISGSSSNGYRVSLPKATVEDEELEPGDVLRVEFDAKRRAFVFVPQG